MRLAQPNPSPQMYFDLASAYYYGGQSEKALEVMQAALKVFPDNAADIQRAITEISSSTLSP